MNPSLPDEILKFGIILGNEMEIKITGIAVHSISCWLALLLPLSMAEKHTKGTATHTRWSGGSC